MFSLREFNHKFLDECSHIVVRNHFAFPLLHAESGSRYLDRHVFLDLHLTSETPVVGDLLAVEETYLGRENFSATLGNAALALSAGTLTTTCRRKEYLLFCKSREKVSARSNLYDLASLVDVDLNCSGRCQLRLDEEEKRH